MKKTQRLHGDRSIYSPGEGIAPPLVYEDTRSQRQLRGATPSVRRLLEDAITTGDLVAGDAVVFRDGPLQGSGAIIQSVLETDRVLVRTADGRVIPVRNLATHLEKASPGEYVAGARRPVRATITTGEQIPGTDLLKRYEDGREIGPVYIGPSGVTAADEAMDQALKVGYRSVCIGNQTYTYADGKWYGWTSGWAPSDWQSQTLSARSRQRAALRQVTGANGKLTFKDYIGTQQMNEWLVWDFDVWRARLPGNNSYLTAAQWNDLFERYKTENPGRYANLVSADRERPVTSAGNIPSGWGVMETERPAFVTDEMLEYLDELRRSGVTNMFGATPYLQEAFPELSKGDARTALLYWMETFKEGHVRRTESVGISRGLERARISRRARLAAAMQNRRHSRVAARVAASAQQARENVWSMSDLNWYGGVTSGHSWRAMVFDAPGSYGINGGRVSKLFVCPSSSRCEFREGIYDYDRGALSVDNAPPGLIDQILAEIEREVPSRGIESSKSGRSMASCRDRFHILEAPQMATVKAGTKTYFEEGEPSIAEFTQDTPVVVDGPNSAGWYLSTEDVPGFPRGRRIFFRSEHLIFGSSYEGQETKSSRPGRPMASRPVHFIAAGGPYEFGDFDVDVGRYIFTHGIDPFAGEDSWGQWAFELPGGMEFSVKQAMSIEDAVQLAIQRSVELGQPYGTISVKTAHRPRTQKSAQIPSMTPGDWGDEVGLSPEEKQEWLDFVSGKGVASDAQLDNATLELWWNEYLASIGISPYEARRPRVWVKRESAPGSEADQDQAQNQEPSNQTMDLSRWLDMVSGMTTEDAEDFTAWLKAQDWFAEDMTQAMSTQEWQLLYDEWEASGTAKGLEGAFSWIGGDKARLAAEGRISMMDKSLLFLREI